MSTPTSAAPVVLVFGLHDPSVRWLVAHLREEGAAAVPVRADLPGGASAAIVGAADACVHVMSAQQGLDVTFLEYWQLCAEAGKARFVAVCDLSALSLDVNEAATIAGRVLEEDVLVTTLPLLDDDEAVMGVLDVVDGRQWFPDGRIDDPRPDFDEAVAAETNTWFDEAAATGAEPREALRAGLLAAAVTIDSRSRAGVGWLVEHLPARSVPAATTVLSCDAERVVVTAGPEGLSVGPALSLVGTSTAAVQVRSLSSLFAPALGSQVPPGGTASAAVDPTPRPGTLLLTEG